MQLTDAQNAALRAYIHKYKDVKGTHSTLMLDGLVDAYASSGILTDALSVKDLERINAAGMDPWGDDDEDCDYDLDWYNGAVKAHDKGTDLECIAAREELRAIGNAGADFEELVCAMSDTMESMWNGKEYA